MDSTSTSGIDSELKGLPEPPVCALGLKLRQLSVYASQRRLCITAALVNAFQEVQQGLLALTRPKTQTIAAEVVPAQEVLLHASVYTTLALLLSFLGFMLATAQAVTGFQYNVHAG